MQGISQCPLIGIGMSTLNFDWQGKDDFKIREKEYQIFLILIDSN